MLRFECDYGEGAAPAVLDLCSKPILTRPPAMARMNTAPGLLHRYAACAMPPTPMCISLSAQRGEP